MTQLKVSCPPKRWFKFLLSKLTVSVLTKCLGCLTTRWSLPWETYNLNGLIADTSCCKIFVTSIKSWIPPQIWTFPAKSDKTLITYTESSHDPGTPFRDHITMFLTLPKDNFCEESKASPCGHGVTSKVVMLRRLGWQHLSAPGGTGKLRGGSRVFAT